jgi:hypothetical protein
MWELKRLVLWFLVLLAPGGLLFLPVLLLDAGKARFSKAPVRRAPRPET